ncbi:MAG: accessory factor UbiK family protein [Gammaproteobacteria bacterium]|nr:accessory factor UbiK family protein [Gammaproteobacteria bacterium]MDD9874627.1 accessory factor UbiK family protein [Gammaproteobacteria bacterium]
MIDQQKLREAVAALLPAEAGQALRDNIEAVIRSNAENLNLVTRERFEVQEKVLQRTRARVRELETRVAELEQRLQAAAGSDETPTQPTAHRAQNPAADAAEE